MTTLCSWFAAHGSSCPELLGFATGVVNVWLVTREHIWSWPVGVINAGFYLVVFSRAGLYADTGLQVVYLLLSLYGWWHWWRGDAKRGRLPVTRTTRRTALALVALGVIAWIALATVTSRIPGAALPWLDAALVAASLVAQWMMTRKLLEHWKLWIIVNVGYIGLFINRALPLTAVLYAIFLLLAVSGARSWARSASRHSGIVVKTGNNAR